MVTNDNIIQVKDLKKYYKKGVIKALDGVSVDIARGDVVVVIGPSGSGKSTLLRSLNLLEEPTSGTIIFEGTDITDKKIDINKHRQKMGMVFQHFNLFPHKTIIENMILAPVEVKHVPKEEAKAKARAILPQPCGPHSIMACGNLSSLTISVSLCHTSSCPITSFLFIFLFYNNFLVTSATASTADTV